VEIKCQLVATEVFVADLIACSTFFGHHYAYHQELKSIIQWLLPVVFRAVVFKLLVWCGAEGYVSGLQDAEASATSWHFISTYFIQRISRAHSLGVNWPWRKAGHSPPCTAEVKNVIPS